MYLMGPYAASGTTAMESYTTMDSHFAEETFKWKYTQPQGEFPMQRMGGTEGPPLLIKDLKGTALFLLIL